MSDPHSWSGVFKHLTFIDNLSHRNGLTTWKVDDDWPWDFPFLNRRKVVFDGPGKKDVGGKAWEAVIPGPTLGLPPVISVKIYVQEKTPDVGFLLAGELDLSFQSLIERFGSNVILNPHVQRIAKPVMGPLREMFDSLARNAPSIGISGALGFSVGVTPDTHKPYIRLLTTAEMKFKTGELGGGVLKGAARIVGLHEVDLTGGAGGGRSWQISSLANIPRNL